jgi:hypothetical protein
MQLSPETIKAIIDALCQPPAKREMHMSDAQVICSRLELLFRFEFPTPQVASKPNEPIEFIAVNDALIPYLDMRISQIDSIKLRSLISELGPVIYKEMKRN